ncbi:MAG: FctA domain-containing protein, partial [Clostridiaceae bacterium]|nr:FctA domain-containing protein [Clostridiaceae bacterium]
HRHVGGEIDFVRGQVRYYDLDVSTGDVSTVPSRTVPFSSLVSTGLNSAGTFENYSSHTFRFYYMERGAGSGVCRMNFNFPLLRKNTITVTKELSSDGTGEILGDPDFRFQILRENGTPSENWTPFVGANVTYELRDAAGNRIGAGVTGTDGVFALKAGQTAVFSGIGENAGRYFVRELLEPDAFGQYGEITVNGSSVTTGTGSTVIVGSDTFTGVDSPVKDMSDGSTAFRFDNRVTFAKLGRLELTKQLDALTDGSRNFDFAVTLDGAPLPVGKTYTVGGETRTVTKAGVVTLAPDETAVIADILAGSRFTVRETAASAEGFRVSYEGEGLTQGSDEAGSFVSGVIYTEQTVAVTVRNAERGASLELPGHKTLENPDGEAHTFSFALEQVTDSTGKTPVEGGTRETASVTMTDDEEDFTFRLAWAEGAVTPPQRFYYRITETADAAGVRYDGTVYVAEVTLAAGTDGIAAALTALWKDGEPLSLPDGQIAFVNALTGVLTVEKRVTGHAPDDEFGFTVTLSRAGLPVSGSFPGSLTAADGTVTETAVQFDAAGTASVRLRAGERLSLTGIPTDAAWRVEEDDPGSYRVSVSVDGGTAEDAASAEGTALGRGSAVVFTNEAVYTLPETGGAGTFPFAVGGLLSAAAAVLLLRNRKKRGKEDPPSS